MEQLIKSMEDFNVSQKTIDGLKLFILNNTNFSKQQLDKFGDVINNIMTDVAMGEDSNCNNNCGCNH